MERELEAVNRFAKTVLTEEQVYIFSVRLCDNEVDRDLERFAAEALETLGELFVGKSGIFDHQWTARGHRPYLSYRDGAGAVPGDGGRRPILLAKRLGVSAADGEKRRSHCRD